MNRVDRLLAVILYLQSRPFCTADEIARHFGRSVRTIYRDIAAVGEAGVPVVAQAGVGYSLAKGYHLPPVSFARDEAAALLTGGLLVERFTDSLTARPMRSALMKVRAVLPRALQAQMVRLERTMATAAMPVSPKGGADLTQIQQALAQQSVLRFRYSAQGRDDGAEREVEPLGLIHYLERWHLIAWCRLRKGVRDFRTDRMSRVSVLRESFLPRPDFGIEEYIRSMPRPELRADVLFAPLAVDRARREWWLGIVAEREIPAGTVLTLASVDWRHLTGWLMSFGEEVRVLSPSSLRKELVRTAKTVSAHHSKIPELC